MAEEQLPDWLTSMRDQPLDQQPDLEEPQPLQPEEEAPQDDALARLMGDLQDQPDQPDMVEDLREQIPDAPLDYEGEPSSVLERLLSVSPFPGLKPWQGLVIAILFLLDVLVCGAMVLAMSGRLGP